MADETVVIIEDEEDILEVLEYNLTREGYQVYTKKDGVEGLQAVRELNPDLVVLDLMLPRLPGDEVCRQLKRDPVTRSIPVVMVTAKSEESDVVLGLGLGADDYIRKPFSPKELVARLKAVLRRGPLREDHNAGERLVRGTIIIDMIRFQVLVDSAEVNFTPTELRLLHLLASHPGRVFTRDQLLNRVIGDHAVVLDRNIDVHIRAIRKKLSDHRELIETVRGVGYRFREESK